MPIFLKSVIWLAGLFAVALTCRVFAAQPASELHWYRGNTHAHTLNSDGDSPPEIVARWYREHGYQFLFITDHDYMTDVAPLNALLGAEEQFLLLPGEEVTQWSDDPSRAAHRVNEQIGASAHVNSLFTTKLVLPVGERKCPHRACGGNAPPDMPIGATFKINLDNIRAAGGLGQINHPNSLWSLRPQDFADVPDGVLLEIWNSAGLIIHNLGGQDDAGSVIPSAEGYWDWMLSRGKIVWGVGCDDSHGFKPSAFMDRTAQAGSAWIMVRAPKLTAAMLQAAMTAGEFYASTGVSLADLSADGARFVVTIAPPPMPLPHWLPPRYSTRFVGQDGKVLATVSGMKPAYQFKGTESYVRAVVTDSNGKQAWTQPVFLDKRKGASPYVRR